MVQRCQDRNAHQLTKTGTDQISSIKFWKTIQTTNDQRCKRHFRWCHLMVLLSIHVIRLSLTAILFSGIMSYSNSVCVPWCPMFFVPAWRSSCFYDTMRHLCLCRPNSKRQQPLSCKRPQFVSIVGNKNPGPTWCLNITLITFDYNFGIHIW